MSRALLMFMRLGALAQIVVGIGLWTGHLYSLVGVHQMIGMAFVVALWAIAIIALGQRRAVGLAGFAIAWGVLVVGFGFAQQAILPGDYHWIIRVLHLAIGLASMPIAERLAAPRPLRAAPQMA